MINNITTQESAKALIAIGRVMLQHNISRRAAMADKHDPERVLYMMQEGLDQDRAEYLAEVDIDTFIDLE